MRSTEGHVLASTSGTHLSAPSEQPQGSEFNRLSSAAVTSLGLDQLKEEAALFAAEFSATPIFDLYGVTDGKAIGTYVEHQFRTRLLGKYHYSPGNSALGIDFPELDVDLKVTSYRQPQSSSPFRDATQKVYGLGYHLLVFVYEKTDDNEAGAAQLPIQSVIFIDASRTADHQTTTGLLGILERDGNIDDIVGFLEERNLPLDDIGMRNLAERILADPPAQGVLTISNALQWRLQYGRAIGVAEEGDLRGVELLHHE